MTKGNVLHQWNKSVKPNLGDRDGWSFVLVLAGKMVQGIFVVRTFLSTNPAGAIPEGGFAVEIDLIVVVTAGTNSRIVHSFDNFS